METSQFIDQLSAGNASEAKETLNNLLSARAFESLDAKKMELAKSIFDTSKKKYEAGVGSSIEILNAETSLKEAETNFLSAVYDLIIAKIDLDKAQGNLK